MLDFVIFAITLLLFLVALLFYLYPGSRKHSTVPGLDPSDAKDGNIPDILQAGSLPEFLKYLHNRFGDISSFWMGTSLVVSIASPELFEQHKNVFDKPAELFALYKPLVGETSILYSNSSDGRKKRKLWDDFFNEENCKVFLPDLKMFINELVEKWSTIPKDQHIPIYQYMVALCMKICTKLAFGDHFNDPKEVVEFNRKFEICWTELEARVSGSIPEPKSSRDLLLTDAVEKMRNSIRKALNNLKKSKSQQTSFLGKLLSQGLNEAEVLDEAMTFVVKYYSFASALAWTLYFIASHPDIQDKLYKEVKTKKTDFSVDVHPKSRLLQYIVDESLRTAAVEPWTARYQDLDIEIGGHIIPKKTPVIHALEVVLQSDKHWVLPKKFDPERFNLDTNESLDTTAFFPFGFAGKRFCPAKNLVNKQMCLLVQELCSNFELGLVDGQVVLPFYRICSRPEDEVWLTLKKRNI